MSSSLPLSFPLTLPVDRFKKRLVLVLDLNSIIGAPQRAGVHIFTDMFAAEPFVEGNSPVITIHDAEGDASCTD